MFYGTTTYGRETPHIVTEKRRSAVPRLTSEATRNQDLILPANVVAGRGAARLFASDSGRNSGRYPDYWPPAMASLACFNTSAKATGTPPLRLLSSAAAMKA